MSSRLGFAMRRLENSLCQPSSKWVPYFELGKVKAAKRRGMRSAFHQLCPRYSGTLTPTVPTAIRLWETFTFVTSYSVYTLNYKTITDAHFFSLQKEHIRIIKPALALCSCTRLLFIFFFCCCCLNPNGSVFLYIAFECTEKAEAERPCGAKRPCLLYQYQYGLWRKVLLKQICQNVRHSGAACLLIAFCHECKQFGQFSVNRAD